MVYQRSCDWFGLLSETATMTHLQCLQCNTLLMYLDMWSNSLNLWLFPKKLSLLDANSSLIIKELHCNQVMLFASTSMN